MDSFNDQELFALLVCWVCSINVQRTVSSIYQIFSDRDKCYGKRRNSSLGLCCFVSLLFIVLRFTAAILFAMESCHTGKPIVFLLSFLLIDLAWMFDLSSLLVTFLLNLFLILGSIFLVIPSSTGSWLLLWILLMVELKVLGQSAEGLSISLVILLVDVRSSSSSATTVVLSATTMVFPTTSLLVVVSSSSSSLTVSKVLWWTLVSSRPLLTSSSSPISSIAIVMELYL